MADLPYPSPDLEVAAALGVLAPDTAAAVPDLRRQLRLGRWRRYGRVVVRHNGPLTPDQLLWVAVLRSPRGVVVSGLTAALLRGLRHPPPPRPQLLVPAGGPLPHLQGVDVARTRLLDERDVHPTAQPPQLRLPRALVDAASRQQRADDVRALVCAGVQQRLARAQDLRAVVHRLGPVLHRVAAWAADLDRDNQLQLDGPQECCLRIPGFWLDERPAHVVAQLRRGLLRGGWRPADRTTAA